MANVHYIVQRLDQVRALCAALEERFGITNNIVTVLGTTRDRADLAPVQYKKRYEFLLMTEGELMGRIHDGEAGSAAFRREFM